MNVDRPNRLLLALGALVLVTIITTAVLTGHTPEGAPVVDAPTVPPSTESVEVRDAGPPTPAAPSPIVPPTALATGASSTASPERPPQPPRYGLRLCEISIQACMWNPSQIDGCVYDAGICSGPPWHGPTVDDVCCPAACVNMYRASRARGATPEKALLEMRSSTCSDTP